MRSGIVTAMAVEALTLCTGRLPAGRVVTLDEGPLIILGGIGRDRASTAAASLVQAGADALISWGVASGLVPRMRPGTLVLPEQIISREGIVHRAAPELYHRACAALNGRFDHVGDSLAESRRVMRSRAEKRDLFRLTGAVAADMESAAVAEIAEAAGIPFLSVRVILDSLEIPLPGSALSAIDEYGTVRPARFMRGLAVRPWEIPGILRLALKFRRAKTALGRAGRQLDRFAQLAAPECLGLDKK